MRQYMLFIREDLEKQKTYTQEENERDVQQMIQWVEELSKTGTFISGEPLESEVVVVRQGEIVHSGAFVETREGISGYMIINAETSEQAAAIARGCPLLGGVVKSVEVRPIQKY